MPQKPVCLFWSSPRWYICLRVIAILNTDKPNAIEHTFILLPKWIVFKNVPFLLADNHVHSLEETSLQCKNVAVCDIPVQNQSTQTFTSEGAGIKQQAINKLLYQQNWTELTVHLTWGNRTCMCMDSWQHQTQTTKPWVWPQSHQHGWSAAQWRGCLKTTTAKSLCHCYAPHALKTLSIIF